MTGLPIESKFERSPNLPIEPEDREDLTQRLNQAYAQGDLDVVRYQELLDGLYAAERQGQLVPLMQMLPANVRQTLPAGIEQNQMKPGELTPAGRASAVESYNQMKPFYWVAGGMITALLLIVLLVVF